MPSTPSPNSSAQTTMSCCRCTHALRRAGAARRVEPERRRVAARRLGVELAGCPATISVPNAVCVCGFVGAADDDDVAQPAAGSAARWRGWPAAARRWRRAARRAGIPHHVSVVVRLPQRVQRHRHGAHLDRAEEAVDELGAVVNQQQHALFRPHREAAQRAGEAVHLVQELFVGDLRDRRTQLRPGCRVR